MATILHLEPASDVRVRFISDLHLGHERSETPSMDKIRPLLQGIGMIVVVGDLAETRPCPWRKHALELREQFCQLCQEEGVEPVLLSGNHDPDTPALLASFWNGSTIAMHGHALYKEVAPWSWEYLRHRKQCQSLIAQYPTADTDLEARLELSRAVCQLTAPILRREGVKNPLLHSFLHCCWPPLRPWNIIWAWLTCGRRANRFAKQYCPQARTIIFGHFHRSGHWRYGERTLLNTGAWFRHATPYYVDMQDGRFIAYNRIQLRS